MLSSDKQNCKTAYMISMQIKRCDQAFCKKNINELKSVATILSKHTQSTSQVKKWVSLIQQS